MKMEYSQELFSYFLFILSFSLTRDFYIIRNMCYYI